MNEETARIKAIEKARIEEENLCKKDELCMCIGNKCELWNSDIERCNIYIFHLKTNHCALEHQLHMHTLRSYVGFEDFEELLALQKTIERNQ